MHSSSAEGLPKGLERRYVRGSILAMVESFRRGGCKDIYVIGPELGDTDPLGQFFKMRAIDMTSTNLFEEYDSEYNKVRAEINRFKEDVSIAVYFVGHGNDNSLFLTDNERDNGMPYSEFIEWTTHHFGQAKMWTFILDCCGSWGALPAIQERSNCVLIAAAGKGEEAPATWMWSRFAEATSDRVREIAQRRLRSLGPAFYRFRVEYRGADFKDRTMSKGASVFVPAGVKGLSAKEYHPLYQGPENNSIERGRSRKHHRSHRRHHRCHRVYCR